MTAPKPPKKPPAAPPAAPVRHSAALAEQILKELEQGMSLRAICSKKGMPDASAVLGWVRNDKDGFAQHYARAREIGYALLADEIVLIADTPLMGIRRTLKPLTIKSANGDIVDTGEVLEEITHEDMLQHRRLQVDTRKWMLSKMLPKIYGDKQQVEHSGAVDIATTLLAARKRSGLS